MLRLGLDIGTNSIGWCLIKNDAHIVALGVRIFSDGRDAKSGASLAVDRRMARGARRRRDRYIGRRSAFLSALIQYGLMPEKSDEARLIAEKDPYDLRVRALDEALHPHEIGRALFHLNQRRGFKSNRKADRSAKPGEEGKIATGAQSLDQAMAELGTDTLGQFLARQSTKRVRMNSETQDYDFYPQRRHVDHEFNRIWEEQAKHHPTLLTQEARAALYRILFFQRPLKVPDVGVCAFVQSERRLAKAHPLFQERRLYEEVNHLKITTPGEPERPLTLEQRNALILELRGKKKVSFATLGKRLKLAPEQSFNKASETRSDLAGNEVYAALANKKCFGKAWDHLPTDRQWDIIQHLMDEENPDALRQFLMTECGLDEEQAQATAKAPLPEGHGRIGETATRKILEELKKEVIPYSEAVRRAGWHHSDDRTGEILDRLPYYGELLSRDIPPGTQKEGDPVEKRWGKITNPTVHIGLRQLEKLVNAIIAAHGRPDEIVVELARDLNLSDDDKKKHEQRIKRDTDAAIRRGEKLEEINVPNNGANRALLKLWEELSPNQILDHCCPYCGKPINIETLFSSEVDIDHIIPYSRSLDDSNANKVVVHRACNRAKGNQTPYERWGHDEDRWAIITDQLSRLHRSKQWRFGPDAMERYKDGGFIARQLTDTQYLSRLAGKYLRSLYPTKDEGRVYVITGRMTSMLRRKWGLNSLLPDHNYVENEHSNAPKNRLDHRHHAIDAVVIALTTSSLLQKIATLAGRGEEQELDRLIADLPQPWEGFREELRTKLQQVTVSHKADHGRKHPSVAGKDVTAGRLHNDTAYGFTGEMAPDGKTPIVVHRISLMSLKPADIINPDRIPDKALRDALYEATRECSGKSFEAALKQFQKTHPVFGGIRRVRVREPLTVIPIRDKAGQAYKGYAGSSNARFNIWRLPDGKWVSNIISTFAAHQQGHEDPRPHPAAKKIMSVRQNDLIAVERNGGPREIMRVIKFTINGQMTITHHNEGGKLDERHKHPDDGLEITSPRAGGLKKMKARQIRIDPLGRVFDPGPRE